MSALNLPAPEARRFAGRVATSVKGRWRNLRCKRLHAEVGAKVRDLDARGIAIVSSNCNAGILYEFASLPKRTPTAGLYFSDRSFATFLVDLSHGRSQQWERLKVEDLRFNPA